MNSPVVVLDDTSSPIAQVLTQQAQMIEIDDSSDERYTPISKYPISLIICSPTQTRPSKRLASVSPINIISDDEDDVPQSTIFSSQSFQPRKWYQEEHSTGLSQKMGASFLDSDSDDLMETIRQRRHEISELLDIEESDHFLENSQVCIAPIKLTCN